MQKIYVTDDEKNIRELIAAFLTREGFEVRTFANGDELLKACESGLPDLVILDIMMPGTGRSAEVRRPACNNSFREGQPLRPRNGTHPRQRRLPDKAVPAAGARSPRQGAAAAFGECYAYRGKASTARVRSIEAAAGDTRREDRRRTAFTDTRRI